MTDPLHQQIVEFVDTYTRTHPYSPSIREIAEGVGRGTSTLMWHLPRMREEGLIDYLPSQPRTYHIPREGETMTSKRDYEALADAIATTPMPQETRDELTDRFILYFESTNAHFDSVRFRDAAGATLL